MSAFASLENDSIGGLKRLMVLPVGVAEFCEQCHSGGTRIFILPSQLVHPRYRALSCTDSRVELTGRKEFPMGGICVCRRGRTMCGNRSESYT